MGTGIFGRVLVKITADYAGNTADIHYSGMPRLRFPLFSVIISPVEPKSRGMP